MEAGGRDSELQERGVGGKHKGSSVGTWLQSWLQGWRFRELQTGSITSDG